MSTTYDNKPIYTVVDDDDDNDVNVSPSATTSANSMHIERKRVVDLS